MVTTTWQIYQQTMQATPPDIGQKGSLAWNWFLKLPNNHGRVALTLNTSVCMHLVLGNIHLKPL
jgi:hypothetical protein